MPSLRAGISWQSAWIAFLWATLSAAPCLGQTAVPSEPTPFEVGDVRQMLEPSTEMSDRWLPACELLPEGLLYRSYLAGPKESRMGTAWLHTSDRGWVWDSTLGGRVGLARSGGRNDSSGIAEGVQVDLEGAAFPRLDVEKASDLESVDYRIGLPVTWRQGAHQAKFALYHLSAHLGDEFLIQNPLHERVNFSRNAVVFGQGLFLTPDLRVYAEVDYAFYNNGGSEPWWFQFGMELAPNSSTGPRGAPFFAANALLRQEVDFGGTWSLMSGWAWRRDEESALFRVGGQASFGKTSQLEFPQRNESHVGFGVWYDY